MHNGTIQFLAYIGVIVWALVVSPRRLRTLLWMTGAWLAGWAVIGTAVLWQFRTNSNAGAILVDLWYIPSFIVPAITGAIQVRRQRRRMGT